MGLIMHYAEGQTPLDDDEKEGLLLPSISTREELDEAEQRNIEDAIRWTIQRRKRFSVGEVLSEQFVKELHQRMLGKVWKWAGAFRNTNKNIGVDKYQVGISLRSLLDDCSYWIENRSYPEDEIAVRLKHRIVSIHCFANGNGRHSRLMADVIIEKLLGRDIFSWGGKNLIHNSGFRSSYLKALRLADRGDYDSLVSFARS